MPALETINSPTITPTQDKPTLILSAFTMVGMLAGMITLMNI